MSDMPESLAKAELGARLSAGAREAIGELVRVMLPDLVRKVIDEEVRRIREEEMALPRGEELAALIRELFAPRVERIAREVAREMVMERLPGVAERLVREEIERIGAA